VRRALPICVAALALAVVLAPAPAPAFQLKLFHTPDGNIGCSLSFGRGSYGGGARCDIAKHRWRAPRKPSYCELDWGEGLAVDAHGRAGFVCAGDTTLHQGRVLAAGRALAVGPYRCENLGAAVRCVNRRNGHGFKISRRVARRF
jgi:hypothetical protein